MEENLQSQTKNSSMSFTDKLTNIFTSPSELFDYVATSEKETSNWFAPLSITILLSIIFTFVVFTRPAIQSQMQEQQEKVFQQRVADGKMTAEQAEMAMEKNPAKPGSPMFLVFGSVGVIFVLFGTLFISALVFWLAGKWFFKTSTSYNKVMEVVGLSMYIMAFGTIITMITIIMKDALHATPSAAFFLNDFDQSNKLHKLYSSLDIFSIWYLTVISIGLSKIFSLSTEKGFFIAFGVWAMYVAVKIFLNINIG